MFDLKADGSQDTGRSRETGGRSRKDMQTRGTWRRSGLLRHLTLNTTPAVIIAIVGFACSPAAPCAGAAPPDGQATPWTDGEELIYEVTWPSGLSLGEARFHARATPSGWAFESRISASLPTMEIQDEYRSTADDGLCSFNFEKHIVHGAKKTKESVSYDQKAHKAARSTLGGGGESEFTTAPCTRDGLTFLYYLRRELGSGSIPPPEDINFGAQYEVTVSYAQSLEIEVGGEGMRADRILVDLTGPASRHSIEMFVAQDAARTPLMVRTAFDLNTFLLKLTP